MHDLFRLHALFRQAANETAWRYTVVEDMAASRFAVLHADLLSSDYPARAQMLDEMSVERITEMDASALSWRGSLAEAVAAHEADFDI
jgi:hypothetical protein